MKIEKMDIQAYCTKQGVKYAVLAERLFPENLAPYHALRRIAEGNGALSADQLVYLSKYAATTVDALIIDAQSDERPAPLSITRADRYEARVDVLEGKARIFKPGTLNVDEFDFEPSSPVSVFFELLEQYTKPQEAEQSGDCGG